MLSDNEICKIVCPEVTDPENCRIKSLAFCESLSDGEQITKAQRAKTIEDVEKWYVQRRNNDGCELCPHNINWEQCNYYVFHKTCRAWQRFIKGE
jgi:hypothetical protein